MARAKRQQRTADECGAMTSEMLVEHAAERASFCQVVLEQRRRDVLVRLNPAVLAEPAEVASK